MARITTNRTVQSKSFQNEFDIFPIFLLLLNGEKYKTTLLKLGEKIAIELNSHFKMAFEIINSFYPILTKCTKHLNH